MLTANDIKKLTEYLTEAFKDIFATKEDFAKLRADSAKLLTAAEKFATRTNKNENEIEAVNQRVAEHEEWIKQVAPKVGVEIRL